MKRSLVALFVAVLVLGTAQVARAEWPPGGPPKHCSPTAWHFHRNGPGQCGWHNVGSLVGRVFKQHAGIALSVGRCESHLDPQARNPRSTASGVFQLIALHWRGKFNPFNPVLNVLFAFRLSHGGTYWIPWRACL